MDQTLDSKLELFDFDCNLTHKDLCHNVKALIQQARAVGVMEMVIPGATIEESQQAIELCRQYPTQLFPTAGGECGLDYSLSFPAPEVQKKWFAEQLAMACALKKPLFLHERLAHDDFIQLIDEAIMNFDGYFPPAVVHCFTGNEDELKAYIARGDNWYIGVTGFICKKQGAALKQMVKHVPRHRLVLETDAPYMGFPNCRRAESSEKEIARITRANARRFLRL
ncbi:unnamed protein product [Peronospora belbahrii]|uniref:TatD related DNase n=1 Tax=Peronospora belbahrii TaxID=622444 RepID=A0AAU9LAA7_9STRA|nr:unnamed protein product [Peronospora belbahrii]